MAAAVAGSSTALLSSRSPLPDDPDSRCSTSFSRVRFCEDHSSRSVLKLSRSRMIRSAAPRSSQMSLEMVNEPTPTSSFCLRPVFSFPESCPDSRTLDRWVREAVVEIVKNLRDAPLLHFVFDSKKSETCKIPREHISDPDRWTYACKSALDHTPDGLILVQRLDVETAESVRKAAAALPPECPLQRQDNLCQRKVGEVCSRLVDRSTDVWGLLVQGRSPSPSSCYILQTTRVAVSGAACTRFCLTRAQCFGPSLQAQIERTWLANA